MLIGVPKEIKNHEYRVGLVPSSVRELVAHGHRVLVEQGAGEGIGAADQAYLAAGAAIAPSADAVWAASELVVKVKEPLAGERGLLHRGQTLFTYLHLAADAAQARDLMVSGATCIAYETVTDANGRLPLLAPMSEVAGRMSIQAGAACLEKSRGGRGVLLAGVTGVAPGKVAILGAGVVGSNAARVAAGIGADVTVLDRSPDALRRLTAELGCSVKTVMANLDAVEAAVSGADLVVCAVLIAGAAAPRLVTRAMLGSMQPGAVIVDVAIDQGGCCETSRPTTHAEPTYVVDGIVHYCVANMPGAVPRTSAFALNNATLPYVLRLANAGSAVALRNDAHLRAGLNVHAGMITQRAVATALGIAFTEALTALA